ncbi:protein SAND-like isoform X1 [Carex littledalei]|uniref:Vacuolar fusion protein MON1 homolog n=1 Tax=Carex littledalei TaxID=544730 RepID=A0A833R6N8_9POAL|nr:protein SAND-like isoform X1 [Carex littledalei]
MDSNPDNPVQDQDPASESDEPSPADPNQNRTDTTEPDDPPPADSDINPTQTSESVEHNTVEPESSVPERLKSLTLQEPSSEDIRQKHVSNGSLPADFYASDEIEIVEEEEEEGGLASSSGGGGVVTWTNRSDGPPSPSSSGYAAEGGSSVASSGGVEEETEGNSDWGREKKHFHEDDGSDSWRKRKKHFFILSNSGKPIYSRYGDEHKLAGFSATLQAIISFVQNSGDSIKFVRAGKHLIIFLVKGPIYLVCISCTDEPIEALRGQLELLYGQMLLILTKSVNRCFEKNPKFDMAPLLGGTDAVFSSLIHSFSWNPATFLHAYTCLPLSYPTRQAASAILQDVAESGILFAILMCKHKVVSLVGAQKASLHPDDIFLLANFILSSESFRTSESFSPICLPRYNPMAFLYAYVHFLDLDTYLVLLTTSSDSFYHLKDCRVRVQNVLAKSNVLSEIQRSMLESGLRIEDLPSEPTRPPVERINTESISTQRTVGGSAGLCHFMYKSVYLNQFVSSDFSAPLKNPNQQKRLYRAYQKMYASMHDKGTGTHKTQFRRNQDYVLFCWITQDFELYATFDPLADKAQAIKVCNRVCQWVRDLENEIFLYAESTFSW